MTDLKLSINNMDKEEKNLEFSNLKHKYNEFNKKYGFRKINPLYIYLTASIISIIWIALIWYYSANSIYSWASLTKMLPHEFGGFLAGTIMPIGFIWMVALYIDRNINSNYEHEVIYPFLQSIIDPHGDTSVITNVIKKKIETETNELKNTIETFENFSNKIAQIHNQISLNIKDDVLNMKAHEQTLNQITTELYKSTTQSDDKTKQILNDLSQSLEILNTTTQSIENKTNSITNNLITHTNKLENSIDELNKQKENIEISTTTALQRATEIANTFSNIGDKLITSSEIANTYSNQILDKIDEKTNLFVIKSNISAERIANVSNDLISSIETINIVSNENKKLTYNALEKISNQSSLITNKLTEQTKQFENKTSTILETINNIEHKFKDINTIIKDISNAIIDNFKNIGNEINLQKDNLFETSSMVAENLNSLSSQIINEKDNFIKSIEDVKNITINTTDDITTSSQKILSSTENIKSVTNEINNLMEQSKSNLSTQAETSLKFATEIRTTLKNQINDLEEIANTISTQTKLGEISIEKQGEKLSSIAEELFLKVDTMNGKISSTINNILNLSSQLDEKFTSMNDNILQKTSTATKIINDNVEHTIEQSNIFRGISSDFAEKSRNTNQQISTLINELKQQTFALENTTKQTKDLVSNISSEIIKASKTLPQLNSSINENTTILSDAIDLTNQKSKQIIENLNMIGNQFTKFTTQKTSEIEYLSNNSAQAITKLANYTNKLSNELKTNLDKLNTFTSSENTNITKQQSEDFLNKSSYIIEKLNSISIDLAQILSPEITAELWSKYNSGHKNVFSKYLNHILSKKQFTNLLELYNNNQDFKDYTKSYISEFDNLILKASNTDKRDILLATITSTDLGKAYMILKEIK